MNDLTVSMVQTSLDWHDPVANRARLAAQLAAALPGPGYTDLIVLPEMFTTGFTLATEAQAEDFPGPTLAWLRTQAAHYGAVVTGSVLSRAEGRCYNRLLWVRPNGTFSTHDKRHLFRLAGEHTVLGAGAGPVPLETWRGWRICPLICYDLRFPVWSRNRGTDPYDVLLYVANWPDERLLAWQLLLRARAIENLAYVVGVNRLGTDGNGLTYSGQSALLDMRGHYLAQAGNLEEVFTHTLRAGALREFRQRTRFLDDADAFSWG